MAKIKPTIYLTNATIEGSIEDFIPNLARDFRHVSLCKARVGQLNICGAKITREFFEGARFGQIFVDDKTEVYDDEGCKLEVKVRVIDGRDHKRRPFPPPYQKVLAFE